MKRLDQVKVVDMVTGEWKELEPVGAPHNIGSTIMATELYDSIMAAVSLSWGVMLESDSPHTSLHRTSHTRYELDGMWRFLNYSGLEDKELSEDLQFLSGMTYYVHDALTETK